MSEQAEEIRNFEFTGRGAEYFRIWIVNLFLSVITLGIYSAWAKVRREQYFHRNTLLDGSGFDYHARPLAILKGRLIAWGLLLTLAIAQHASPALYGLLLLLSLPLLPWLLGRSLKFRAASTSYRGVRFSHRGTYGGAFKAYVGHGLLVGLTLGLWLPVWARAIRRFHLDPLSFGTADFSCTPRTRGFYGAFLLAGLLPLAAFILVLIAVGMTIQNVPGEAASAIKAIVPTFTFIIAFIFARALLQVRLSNLTWNATQIEGRNFLSTQTVASYLRVAVANAVLIMLTLGLYWPWAKVRLAAYRATHLAVAGDLESFVAGEAVGVSALGDEFSEAFDLDIAL